MYVGEICTRAVAIAERTTTITQAAQRMREYHVGSLVIVERNGVVRPVGIVTDRDLVTQVLAAGLPADELTLGELAEAPLVTAEETDDLMETLQHMREHGIRRMPVVDGTGALSGVLSVDDVLEFLAAALGQIPQLIRSQADAEMQRPA